MNLMLKFTSYPQFIVDNLWSAGKLLFSKVF